MSRATAPLFLLTLLSASRVDYSHGKLPGIDESNGPDENLGHSYDEPNSLDLMTFRRLDAAHFAMHDKTFYTSLKSGPVNWDHDYQIREGMLADLNQDRLLTELKDFDDWTFIKKSLK